MTFILAVDPGPTESAFVVYDIQQDRPTRAFGILPNEGLLREIATQTTACAVVIEKIESFGMAVGAEVFETCVWSGRFIQKALDRSMHVDRIPRREVKLALCKDSRAKDANIRQALINRYGGDEGKAVAVGTKKAPGPLYGFKDDIWSALAVACTYADTRCALPF